MKAAEKRIEQMADADPVIKTVLENHGIAMPELAPGQAYPDEYVAIPKRFRAKKGAGLALDDMADHVAGLSGRQQE